MNTSYTCRLNLFDFATTLTVILLLAAITIPQFILARELGQQRRCISNLDMIEDAKLHWALTHNLELLESATLLDIVSASTNSLVLSPRCEAGGTYLIGDIHHLPICSMANKGHVLP